MELINTHGICMLSMVPMRTEPGSKNEMCNQLLFGDCYQIIDQKEDWFHIKTVLDNYSGWIHSQQYHPLSQLIENFELKIQTQYPYLQLNKKLLPFGCSLWLNNHQLIDGNEIPNTAALQKNQLIEIAEQFIGVPYLWGGRTAMGLDCSGFTQIVYKSIGINILRDAWQQAGQGTNVDFPELVTAGDLAFFDNAEGKITHVGILINRDKIIHASGEVRYDTFDHNGIYNHALGRYTHKLRTIRRILN